MHWSEICRNHPNKWLIVEALEAHTTPDHRRQLDLITVVEECADGKAAMKRYRLLHQRYPEREFYFFVRVVIHLIFKCDTGWGFALYMKLIRKYDLPFTD